MEIRYSCMVLPGLLHDLLVRPDNVMVYYLLYLLLYRWSPGKVHTSVICGMRFLLLGESAPPSQRFYNAPFQYIY